MRRTTRRASMCRRTATMVGTGPAALAAPSIITCTGERPLNPGPLLAILGQLRFSGLA